MTALSTSILVLSGVWSAALEVYPSRGNGFAAAIVGALVAMGLLLAGDGLHQQQAEEPADAESR